MTVWGAAVVLRGARGETPSAYMSIKAPTYDVPIIKWESKIFKLSAQHREVTLKGLEVVSNVYIILVAVI